jgi:hypothetical protein
MATKFQTVSDFMRRYDADVLELQEDAALLIKQEEDLLISQGEGVRDCTGAWVFHKEALIRHFSIATSGEPSNATPWIDETHSRVGGFA